MLEIAKARGRAATSAQHLVDYKITIEDNMKDGIEELYTRAVRAIYRLKIKSPKGMQPPKDRP